MGGCYPLFESLVDNGRLFMFPMDNDTATFHGKRCLPRLHADFLPHETDIQEWRHDHVVFSCAVIQREHGQAVAEELEHGLSLLREYSNMRACFWTCPFCPSKEGAPRQFTSAKDFLTHVDACHEGVQLSEDGLPFVCQGCSSQARNQHAHHNAQQCLGSVGHKICPQVSDCQSKVCVCYLLGISW